MATHNNAAPSHKNPNNYVRNGQAIGESEAEFSARREILVDPLWVAELEPRPVLVEERTGAIDAAPGRTEDMFAVVKEKLEPFAHAGIDAEPVIGAFVVEEIRQGRRSITAIVEDEQVIDKVFNVEEDRKKKISGT